MTTATSKSKSMTIRNIPQMLRTHSEQLSEGFWFTASLALFLLLGPFAAPIVLVALYNLRHTEMELTEPEPQKAHYNHENN